MDARLQEAQRLYREIQDLQQQSATAGVLPRWRELAGLREERAWQLLATGNCDGWIDLFTAITAWGKAGADGEAKRVVERGRQLAAALGTGRQSVEDELAELEQWLEARASESAHEARSDAIPMIGK